MLTLPDPKHEAFATLRASGHDVAAAYVHAGYSVKNIKQRSRKLLQNTDIQARIEHLKTCLPRIQELHAHHCPTLRLMPETRHEMLVWLWQVMNGTRLVKPAQMRAATLYCRMHGWHLAKLLATEPPATSAPGPTSAPPGSSTKDFLNDCEQVLLAMISLENIEHERTGMPLPTQKLTRFQSLMADHAHPCCRTTSTGVPLPEPAPSLPISPATPTPGPSINPPIHPSPHTSTAPVSPSHDCGTPTLSPACGTDPASAGLSKNPQSIPHPKPLTLNRIPPIHPQPRTFFLSSKADPASAPPPFLPFPQTAPNPLSSLPYPPTPLPFTPPVNPSRDCGKVHPARKSRLQLRRPLPAQRPLQFTR